MKEFNELVALAEKADSVASLMDGVNPHAILAIADAFLELKKDKETAEKARDRWIADYKHLVEQHMPRTGDGCEEGWSRVIEARELQNKLEAAEREAANSKYEWGEAQANYDSSKKETAALRAKLAELKESGLVVPDGWKLVPVAPDWNMLSANGCKEHHNGQPCLHHDNRKRIWSAMLAAAPTPPQ